MIYLVLAVDDGTFYEGKTERWREERTKKWCEVGREILSR